MSIDERVGRHTRDQGRQCRNLLKDQQTVTDLLNRIPVNQGGAGGTLPKPIHNGTCSPALYRAISQFEDKYFPGQRRGFVEPGGAMLKRMEELAGQAAKAAAETPLDVLRRNVLLHDSSWSEWTASELASLDRSVKQAVRYIDDLKARGLVRLPTYIVLFGSAWIQDDTMFSNNSKRFENFRNGGGLGVYTVDVAGQRETPSIIYEWYAKPVNLKQEVYTGAAPALLLFQNGSSLRLGPFEAIRMPDRPHDSSRVSVGAYSQHLPPPGPAAPARQAWRKAFGM